MTDTTALFTPHAFAGLELSNRLVLAPMTRTSAQDDGQVHFDMVDYYRDFARGNFSLLITEGIYTDEAFSQGYANQPGLANQAQQDSWRPVVDAVHQQGGRIIAQLMHAGAQTQHNRFKDEVVAQLATEDGPAEDDIKDIFKSLEKQIVRGRILAGEPRIDGRDNRTVRAIACEVDILPKAHGSALFTRGETQAIGAVTLGSTRDAQIIDALEGERRDPFMLHYNFPPYSVGEAGRIGFTGRREIGHGRLARRGLAAVLPGEEEFPYTVRVVSEITESNGSSSMASVCVGSLSMMAAGVPLSAPVAGIAMGLVKEGNQFAVLTDILGDEDHLGDMDFKVAGTAKGVTALQMDIKIEGINEEIMERALEQALEARLHILGQMNTVLDAPREITSENAPSMTTLKVDQDKIRDIIGKGGATIRQITEESGATVDIDDDGTVKVFGQNAAARDAAIEMIQAITAEAEVGEIYTGKVARIVDFGAFVTILPGKDGLVHISQIAEERVENVTDYVSEGQEVQVKVLDVDQRGRIKLSMREVAADAADAAVDSVDSAEPEEESLAQE